MSAKRYEVRVRGRRAITVPTLAEAKDWADLLTTTTAPATIHDLTPPPATTAPDPTPGPDLFTHLEDTTP